MNSVGIPTLSHPSNPHYIHHVKLYVGHVRIPHKQYAQVHLNRGEKPLVHLLLTKYKERRMRR
jgi:hypothetical protein